MGKINAETLLEIRDAYETSDTSIAQICRDFGVSRSWFNTKRKEGNWLRVESDAEVDEEFAAVQRELAEARARLRELEPEEHQWITDLESAEAVLAPTLEQRIEDRWVEYMEERDARNLPRPERMTAEWAERTKLAILTEAVASLTASATDEGPATRTQAWQKPDGTIVKLPYDISIGNYAVSPTAYEDVFRGKGFRKLSPQPCLRENCWDPGPGEQVHLGGNLWGGSDFDGYCGESHRRLDDSMGQSTTRATTTSTFDI